MIEPVDESAARAAALQAERERLAARQAVRAAKRADREAWRLLGVDGAAIVDVRRVLHELTMVTQTEGPVRACLASPPDDRLRGAVADLLRALVPDLAAAFVRDLQEAGFPLVEARMMSAVRLLAQQEIAPGQLEAAQAIDAGRAWTLYVDALAVLAGREPVAARMLVAEAPLMVASLFLESADVEVDPAWWDDRPDEERTYLTARVRPDLLTDREVEELGWDEELHRRRLAAGHAYRPGDDEEPIELFELISAAACGDVDVLGRLEELLPEENATVVRSIRSGATTGTWPDALLQDRGLWQLLARHLPDEVTDPDRGPFYKWAAFRRAYELTKSRRVADAWEQCKAFTVPSRPSAPPDKEIQNLRAYITLLNQSADENEMLNRARDLLQPMRGDSVVRENLGWIKARLRQTRNQRGMAGNPYLYLGLDHGASAAEWKAAWRKLRRRYSGDVDAMSSINEAKDLIEAMERIEDGDSIMAFQIPLKVDRFSPECGKPWRLLVPDGRTLPLCRAKITAADDGHLRAGVIAALVDGIK